MHFGLLLLLRGNWRPDLTAIDALLRIELYFQRPPAYEVAPAIDATPAVPPQYDLNAVRKRSVIMVVRPLRQVHFMAARALREQQMREIPDPVAEPGVAFGAF